MTVAWELGKDYDEIVQMGHEKLGWWIAYFKYKAELESKASKKKGSDSPTGGKPLRRKQPKPKESST